MQRVADAVVIRVRDGGARTEPKLADPEPGTEGLRAVGAKPLVKVAEARGFEPRMGVNPNRISSAAP